MRTYLILLCACFTAGCVTTKSAPATDGQVAELCQRALSSGQDDFNDGFWGNREIWQLFNKKYQQTSPRKLLVFLDGTHNDKSSRTNVRKLYLLAIQHACREHAIVPYYDRGVGAEVYNAPDSDTMGTGLSLNIRQAYRFLVESYNQGDELYLFGFSRGAFTARSLNGFVEYAGLLDRQTVKKTWREYFKWVGASDLHYSVKDLFDIYKTWHDGTPRFEERLRERLRDERERQEVKAFESIVVSAIGVFDTVPALGLSRDDEPDNHRFELYAREGFHALSLDEQRDDFRLLRFNPWKLDGGQRLVEVWFSGGHSDIGGSYSKTIGCQKDIEHGADLGRTNYRPGLGATTLKWMLENFRKFDLFPTEIIINECPDGSLHDEFFGSLGWAYQSRRLTDRTKQRTPQLGDYIHEAVLQRLATQPLPDPHPQREPEKTYLFLGQSGKSALDRFFPFDSSTGRPGKQYFRIYPER